MYIVRLTEEQRVMLQALASSAQSSMTVRRAGILLHADRGPCRPLLTYRYCDIADMFNVSIMTVSRICRIFCMHGLDAALTRRPYPKLSHRKMRRHFSDVQRSMLVALSNTSPPSGYKRWTLRLLTQQAVVQGIVSSISLEAVRYILRDEAK